MGLFHSYWVFAARKTPYCVEPDTKATQIPVSFNLEWTRCTTNTKGRRIYGTSCHQWDSTSTTLVRIRAKTYSIIPKACMHGRGTNMNIWIVIHALQCSNAIYKPFKTIIVAWMQSTWLAYFSHSVGECPMCERRRIENATCAHHKWVWHSRHHIEQSLA